MRKCTVKRRGVAYVVRFWPLLGGVVACALYLLYLAGIVIGAVLAAEYAPRKDSLDPLATIVMKWNSRKGYRGLYKTFTDVGPFQFTTKPPGGASQTLTTSLSTAQNYVPLDAGWDVYNQLDTKVNRQVGTLQLSLSGLSPVTTPGGTTCTSLTDGCAVWVDAQLARSGGSIIAAPGALRPTGYSGTANTFPIPAVIHYTFDPVAVLGSATCPVWAAGVSNGCETWLTLSSTCFVYSIGGAKLSSQPYGCILPGAGPTTPGMPSTPGVHKVVKAFFDEDATNRPVLVDYRNMLPYGYAASATAPGASLTLSVPLTVRGTDDPYPYWAFGTDGTMQPSVPLPYSEGTYDAMMGIIISSCILAFICCIPTGFFVCEAKRGITREWRTTPYRYGTSLRNLSVRNLARRARGSDDNSSSNKHATASDPSELAVVVAAADRTAPLDSQSVEVELPPTPTNTAAAEVEAAIDAHEDMSEEDIVYEDIAALFKASTSERLVELLSDIQTHAAAAASRKTALLSAAKTVRLQHKELWTPDVAGAFGTTLRAVQAAADAQAGAAATTVV